MSMSLTTEPPNDVPAVTQGFNVLLFQRINVSVSLLSLREIDQMKPAITRKRLYI